MTRHRDVRAILLVLVIVCLPAVSGAPRAQVPAPTDSDRFYDAIRAGDTAKVRQLVDGGADVNGVERRGGATPLMHAAAVGSLDTMRLLLDRGANVNARSFAGATALMWAINDLPKVRLLLDRQADVNLSSSTGRTALLLAAMSDRSAPIVRLLLARGANPRLVDADKMTTLVAATSGNDTETIRLMVEAGVDVNAAADQGDVVGTTPLMNAAAEGNLEAVSLLLARGARVNTVSGPPSAPVKNGIIQLGHFTPLLLASTFGPDPVVKALVSAGADVNAKDARGLTPLMMAVSADHGDPKVVKTLLARGADAQAKSLTGETAMDWALKSGPTTPQVAMLKASATARPMANVPVAVALPVAAPRSSARTAVERGIDLMQQSTGKFFVSSGCASCHAQNITDVAVAEARLAGVKVDEAGAEQRGAGAAAQFNSIATRLLERVDGPATDILLYTMLGFAAAAHPADRATDALVFNIAAQQNGNGTWHRGAIARPPAADGDVSSTALGIRALAAYGPPGRRTEMNERIQRSMGWLRSTRATTAEDRAFRILGLLWGGAEPDGLRGFVREALAMQHTDGGFAQNSALESDAYATSITLFAVLRAGGAASDAPIRRAIDYLLSTQLEDGSWLVRSRAPKFQPYFDGGFPHQHDQWISSMATGWATAALASSLQTEHSRQAAR